MRLDVMLEFNSVCGVVLECDYLGFMGEGAAGVDAFYSCSA